jgi:heavy metal sensor kinase
VGGFWLATRAIRPIEDISSTAMKIAEGDLSLRINTANTDNELGRLAQVLNSTFTRLEAAFAQQARFTSDASHELRTPLAVIITQMQQALSRERTVDEYRNTLAASLRAAQRMRGLTESLLQLARLDAGLDGQRKEKVDLNLVVRDAVDLIQPLAVQGEITIQQGTGEAIMVLGDAGQLGQVVTNLLSNAIQFNRKGGWIKVEVARREGFAELRVSDNGEGIAEHDLPHVCERFYVADKSRSRLQNRTGLGLSICKAIVEAHKGTLEVTGKLGEGTTVLVKLPIVP